MYRNAPSMSDTELVYDHMEATADRSLISGGIVSSRLIGEAYKEWCERSLAPPELREVAEVAATLFLPFVISRAGQRKTVPNSNCARPGASTRKGHEVRCRGLRRRPISQP